MSDSRDRREATFQELVFRNRGRLARIARAYAFRESDDLLQEILLQLWRALDTFRGQSQIDSWAYRVALNVAISWSRRRVRRESRDVASIDVVEPARTLDGADEAKLLERFLATLAEIDRATLVMFLDDFDARETAEALGTTEGAIRVRLHRIRLKLSEWEPLDP